ncbi:MAG: DEAD/DEAH box helicase family protein [Gemmataceae bacterium]
MGRSAARPPRHDREPFPHQTETVETWWKHRGQGVVVLPTGTGKTFTAVLAIAKAARPALVLTPTIDLLNQWYDELLRAFGGPVGLMGGGHHELHPLTVTTYDSAYIYLEKWGNRFGLLVFDECHHLPGPTYALSAVGSLAPFRLGLTATPERADGLHERYADLIGPVVFRREIKELAGDFHRLPHRAGLRRSVAGRPGRVHAGAEAVYRQFVEARGISMGRPEGLRRFLRESYRTTEGRAAFRAFREQKRLAQRRRPSSTSSTSCSPRTAASASTSSRPTSCATVYQIARRFLVPAITHQTKAKGARVLERSFGRVRRRRDEPGVERRRGRAGREPRRHPERDRQRPRTSSGSAGCSASTRASRPG